MKIRNRLISGISRGVAKAEDAAVKPHTFIVAIILVLCLALGAYSFAQTGGSSTPPDNLQAAIALLNQNQLQQAQQLFASVSTNSPDYNIARCYDALCLYQLDDKRKFLRILQSSAVQNAQISQDMAEDLEFKQIDALFFYRRFEELFPAIAVYQAEYPNLTRIGQVTEYQTAGLFERGTKKIFEAVKIADTNQFLARWVDGQTNIQAFLSLASAFPGTNYTYLQDRNLQREVWAALVLLGDETATMNVVQSQDFVTRERFGFLRVLLHKRLYPGQLDQNLQLMSDFLSQFPASSNVMRVQFDTADISFPRAEHLCLDADALEKAGNYAAAATNRYLAHYYLGIERAAQSQVATNRQLGIEGTDLLALRDDLLYGYYLEKNYTAITPLTAAMITNSQPGDLAWIVGKLYNGILLMSQSPPNTNQAALLFDQILAQNFNGRPSHDHKIIDATKWRLYVARRSGNQQKAIALVQWVQASKCNKNQMAVFLAKYGFLIGLANTNGTQQ